MSLAIESILRFDWTGLESERADAGGPVLDFPSFQADNYYFLNAFIHFVRGLPDLPEWYLAPVDLLEAVRVEMLVRLRGAVRDWMTWRRLYERRPQDVRLSAPARLHEV